MDISAYLKFCDKLEIIRSNWLGILYDDRISAYLKFCDKLEIIRSNWLGILYDDREISSIIFF
jgi:hypothetical protein